MDGLSKQQEHAREVLARSHVADWEKLQATTCYAADQCQYDLGCPFLSGCRAADAELRDG